MSIDGARKNLQAEIPGWDFDGVRAGAERSWNEELEKIAVEGGSKEQRVTFYTALYHAMIAPNTFSDVDGSYRGMDGQIRHADDPFTTICVTDNSEADDGSNSTTNQWVNSFPRRNAICRRST